MNNVTKSSLDRLIRKYVLEIIVVISILVISFIAFSTANLSSAALVAKTYDEGKYNVQVMYGRTSEDSNAIASRSDIIDKGELTVKNPNKTSIYTDTVLMIKKTDNLDLKSINMTIDDTLIDLSNATLKDEYYELVVKSQELDSYSSFKSDVTIYGDSLYTPKFEYSFKIIESFYE